MDVSIEPASPEHAQEVLAFELENRDFFERWMASRGDEYYHLDRVRRSLSEAQQNRRADRA
ncbi:MAG: hypothetical protein AAGI71_15530 [Bacteroidota bacterium]